MGFEQPLLLLSLLAVAAAAAAYYAMQRRPARYAVNFTNLTVLEQVVGGRSWRRWVPPALFLLALAVLAVALARPHVTRTVASERATVILVVDTSRSMLSEDVRPSRLIAARRAALAFLERVPDRLQVGLITFSGEVQVTAVPTRNRLLVRDSIRAIEPFYGFGGGTAIGDAIVRAVELGERTVSGPTRELAGVGTPAPPSGAARGVVSIVFLSDGRQNRGVIQPLAGAARAREAGIPVHTVALGRNGEDSGGFGGGWNRAPDPETLRAIARTTGGRFFNARTARAARVAYTNLGSTLGRERQRTEVTFALGAVAGALVIAAGALSARTSARLP